ncbi:MAG TPA: Ger(x)C family spore germination C-terminal domain-containing protein, partial [Defluviitaleaceae bacterium]|nr:Ger(x)C family spore germination C-terminal domain-containing protein [Defluviitaleaceae bacterium]
LKIKQEEYIGLFIYDLLRNEITKDFADVYQVFEYLNDRHFGQAISVMSIIRIKEETIQEDLIIEGSGIIKDGKMIEKMEGKDAASHSAIVGKESIKIINIPNPMNKESDLILEMIDSNLSINMIYKDNQIILKKDFDIRASLAESQKPIIFEDPKIQKEVEKLAEKEFEKMCMETFEKYKKKGLDVFRIKEMMLRKYPNIDIENPIRITDLKISVNMKLEGSSDVIGFKK